MPPRASRGRGSRAIGGIVTQPPGRQRRRHVGRQRRMELQRPLRDRMNECEPKSVQRLPLHPRRGLRRGP